MDRWWSCLVILTTKNETSKVARITPTFFTIFEIKKKEIRRAVYSRWLHACIHCICYIVARLSTQRHNSFSGLRSRWSRTAVWRREREKTTDHSQSAGLLFLLPPRYEQSDRILISLIGNLVIWIWNDDPCLVKPETLVSLLSLPHQSLR